MPVFFVLVDKLGRTTDSLRLRSVLDPIGRLDSRGMVN
jgi:hypothetical protein